MVRLPPSLADCLAKTREKLAFIGLEARAGFDEIERGGYDLAIHIELRLAMRSVADPDRTGRSKTGEVIKRLFPQVRSAIHVVHDLEFGPSQARRVQEPLKERARLALIAETREGPHRQRSVAKPAVTVIPVAVRSDGFGQRGGRSRND